LKNFLRFIRFPNLIIVGLTQYLMRYCILQPFYSQLNIAPSLDAFHFFLLVLTTMLIAAGGYVINDIYDYDIDKINKPDKVFVGRIFGLRKAWRMYAWLNIAGIAIALYVAWRVGDMRLALLFPAAAVPLWLYSRQLKKTALMGNVVVSLFCALVALLVLFAERNALLQITQTNKEYGEYVFYLFWGYAAFAYLSTMFREIVKDMEDVEGDTAQGCRTMPVIWGIPAAKNIAGGFGLALAATVFMLMRWQWQNFDWHWLGMLYTFVLIFVPILLALLLLSFAKSKADMHRLSGFLKLIMLTGLLYLPVFCGLFLFQLY